MIISEKKYTNLYKFEEIGSDSKLTIPFSVSNLPNLDESLDPSTVVKMRGALPITECKIASVLRLVGITHPAIQVKPKFYSYSEVQREYLTSGGWSRRGKAIRRFLLPRDDDSYLSMATASTLHVEGKNVKFLGGDRAILGAKKRHDGQQGIIFKVLYEDGTTETILFADFQLKQVDDRFPVTMVTITEYSMYIEEPCPVISYMGKIVEVEPWTTLNKEMIDGKTDIVLDIEGHNHIVRKEITAYITIQNSKVIAPSVDIRVIPTIQQGVMKVKFDEETREWKEEREVESGFTPSVFFSLAQTSNLATTANLTQNLFVPKEKYELQDQVVELATINDVRKSRNINAALVSSVTKEELSISRFMLNSRENGQYDRSRMDQMLTPFRIYRGRIETYQDYTRRIRVKGKIYLVSTTDRYRERIVAIYYYWKLGDYRITRMWVSIEQENIDDSLTMYPEELSERGSNRVRMKLDNEDQDEIGLEKSENG